jgi:hypothetical protein
MILAPIFKFQVPEVITVERSTLEPEIPTLNSIPLVLEPRSKVETSVNSALEEFQTEITVPDL